MSFSTDSSANFSYYISLLTIVIILYLSTSDYLLVGIEFIYETLGVGEQLKKLAKDYISLVVCPCVPSSCYFVYALYLWHLTLLFEPYWCIPIHPSEYGARLNSCDFRLGLY